MSDLQTLHGQLLGMLEELEDLTAQPMPDEAALASLRYRLTRTSGARRRLVDSLCVQLQLTLAPEEAAAVRALREASIAAMTSSSDHIGTWSLRQLAKDWPGYCRASQQVRGAMREQIEAERTILYPHIAPDESSELPGRATG
ncbi:hypothetical protein FHS95_001831 [Sphingomonas naasensis]|uniref:Uncharacterized protein n=1 Tax=Sphingomonas naasensis TaxID=1344951 RepID=A0A4S1WQH9_9SPHN|nr:hypothetical protein [Sphingomonas naasensis]NIJ20139.1 hypothetical protein [Sphingomonas naasensis]TGX44290.1 hypothetical protein E5A74_05675 [Sphingomonas naasensis]